MSQIKIFFFGAFFSALLSCSPVKQADGISDNSARNIDSVVAAKTLTQEFSDAIIERFADINDLTNKGWEYNNSIVLIGIEKMYYASNDEKYLNYIKHHVDKYVDADGNIDFDPYEDNLDCLHPGWLLITLYEETGEVKYKLAAQKIRAEFDNQPRNSSGGFWHKKKYPNQMWADGIYMAEPFLIRYGAAFDDMDYCADEVTKQATLLATHAYDSTLNLIKHGWDETKTASWADTETGLSPEVWSRGLGWYCMALVDIFDYLPKDHPKRDRLIEITSGLAKGIAQFQDSESGLWYQVVDKAEKKGNWLESSGSAMFVYFLKKASDNNYIDAGTYLPVAEKGWNGLQAVVTRDSHNQPVINQFVRGMGIKNNYNEYISEEIVSTPSSRFPHGYCGILLAASVMEYNSFLGLK